MAESESHGAPPTAESLRIDRAPRPVRRRGGAGAWLVGGAVLVAAGALGWSLFGRAGALVGGVRVKGGQAARLSADLAADKRTTASGYVVARKRAAISPKYPGKLVRLFVDVGDVVEEGQVLAELDHAELDSSVARVEADLARAASEVEVAARTAAERGSAARSATTSTVGARAAQRQAEARRDDSKREAERLDRLVKERIVTESERDRGAAQARMDAAEAERTAAMVASAVAEEERASKDAETAVARVASAKAALASAEASLREIRSRREDSFIRADFRGKVLRKEAEVGEVIAPASTGGGSTRGALLTLADFETLEMEVDVFERDVSQVEEKAPCRIVLDAYPKSPFPGKVRQVVPTADRQKATVQVKVSFDAPDPRVLPEMGGKVVFLAPGTRTSAEADRVTVPTGAVVEREGRRGVFLIVRESTETRARFATIVPGEESGGRTVAASGLEGGERVVLDPGAALRDGDLITVEEGK